MKRYTRMLCIAICVITTASAQVSVNKDGSTPHPSAMLQVKSDNKGVLLPRLILDSLYALQSANPAHGLLIFLQDNIGPSYRGFYYYDSIVGGFIKIRAELEADIWYKQNRYIFSGDVFADSVGIGTATPAGKLHIAGAGHTLYDIISSGASSAFQFLKDDIVSGSPVIDNTKNAYYVIVRPVNGGWDNLVSVHLMLHGCSIFYHIPE